VLNLSKYGAVRHTNSLFMSLLGNIKVVVIVVIAHCVLDETLSATNWAGIATAAVAFCLNTGLQLHRQRPPINLPPNQPAACQPAAE
jgi:drug/metabolite transporter (DMT)-like permease